MTSAGSSVGLPSRSRAQPSGMRSPSFAAMTTFDIATTDVAMSRTIGGREAVGKAQAIGFVESTRSIPPQGAIHGSPFVTAWATSPCSAARST